MSVDPKLLSALSSVVAKLENGALRPIPQSIIKTLAPLARPGLQLKIDLDASQAIGAPLVMLSDRRTDSPLLSALTPRQKQVAKLVTNGLTNRQIAAELGITIATVKDHVHAILQRLDLPSRATLTAALNTSSNQ